MEQDVHTFNTVCSTCLSTDRYTYCLSESHPVYQIFRLLMHDFEADRFGESTSRLEHTVCWECLALLKKFSRFKNQVHSAQEHLRILAMSRTQESMDHTYMSQSLSTLEATMKTEYDKIYLYYTQDEYMPTPYVESKSDVKSEQYDVSQVVRENIALNIDDHILEVPELVLENPVTGTMSRIVVGTDALVSPADALKRDLGITTIEDADTKRFKVSTIQSQYVGCVPEAELLRTMDVPKIEELPKKTVCNTNKTTPYVVDYMTDSSLMAMRAELKEKVQYASSAYKCELCIIGFYTQQQVEDHFLSDHRAKPGRSACPICYIYVDDAKLTEHTDSHYLRYTCKLCGCVEYSEKIISLHVNTHMSTQQPNNVIRLGNVITKSKKKNNSSQTEKKPPPKPGDLRKLLSKTTIEGYQCLECDMFFKSSRVRKTHVARCHREGFQCDHCKKRFVNKTTLATHLRLHEGPLPREECPICHKMVRVIQLKYHVRRHQNKKRYECLECNKTFSHLATYQGHLKYSRAHATEQVFKFPCPMCNKGYPSKEAMQDHFNYQHLGKTSHKCPVCDKPIASRANVEKHLMRMHGQKKEKPRNHVCQVCGKAFTDKKALNQHEVIHSGERPLTCDICHQSFRQKASLYTHKKRVHKVFPVKRTVQYVEPNSQ